MTLEVAFIFAVLVVALDTPSEPKLPLAITTDIPLVALVERPKVVATHNISTLWRNAVRGAVD